MAEEYEVDWTIQEQIGRVTLQQRSVDLAPFLIETMPCEVGWEPLPLDDPEVKQILKRHRVEGSPKSKELGEFRVIAAGKKPWTIRVRSMADGSAIAERSRRSSQAKLAERLTRSGFRFPTLDEWEYACGGGAKTLFRWGDHVPCDRYPIDISPAETAWYQQFVASCGKLPYPPKGFPPDWTQHRRPNAFGVYIASDRTNRSCLRTGYDPGRRWRRRPVRRIRFLGWLAHSGDSLFRGACLPLQPRDNGRSAICD